MPENQIAIYTDGNSYEVIIVEVTLSNATFTLWGGPQLFFNFDSQPPDTPLYGFQLDSTKTLMVGKMNGGSIILGVTSDEDTVNGTVTVSPALTQPLYVKVGNKATFELQPGTTQGQFSLSFPGDTSPRPQARALSPELEELLRSAFAGDSAPPTALAEPKVDILTATSNADAVVPRAYILKLTNGTASYYDHPLVPPSGAFIGAGDPIIAFFPMNGFALTGGVQDFELIFDVESADSELRGELLLPPKATLAAPLNLATVLAGGSFTFPAGSSGGPFSLPLGGGSLAAGKLRALRRTASRQP